MAADIPCIEVTIERVICEVLPIKLAC